MFGEGACVVRAQAFCGDNDTNDTTRPFSCSSRNALSTGRVSLSIFAEEAMISRTSPQPYVVANDRQSDVGVSNRRSWSGLDARGCTKQCLAGHRKAGGLLFGPLGDTVIVKNEEYSWRHPRCCSHLTILHPHPRQCSFTQR